MKKMLLTALTILLLLPAFATNAWAHGHGRGHADHHSGGQHKVCVTGQTALRKETCTANCTYVDENGDNICDKCKNECPECGQTKDDNADGICDNCGKCAHYADENKDGICDHQAECAGRKKPGCKTANRTNGHHGGNHGKCR